MEQVQYLMHQENISQYPVDFQEDVNYVQQYLRVTLLLDISKDTATAITHEALKGQNQPQQQTTYQWPHHP